MMKNKTLYILPAFFLFLTFSYGQTYPVTAISNNGPDDKRINYVFLGDGYTSAQQTAFINDAQNVTNDLFTQSPFVEYAAFFNTYAIEVPSSQSGADHPTTASDEGSGHPYLSVNTVFDGTFDYYQIHRLLVPTNSTAVYTVLNNNFPNHDQIIILENSAYYGGSGGALATTSVHPSAPEIAIHEIGHSFPGLSDEYWAGDFYANENYNMTQETNPALVRWKNWYGDNGIGIYPYGASGSPATWYRPHQNCKMQYLGSPFCAVCKERIIDVIYSLISPLENFVPSNAALLEITRSQTFDLDVIYPNPNTLSLTWTLNGVAVATNTETIVLDDANLLQGMNTLTVTIVDETEMSRSYWPGAGYVFSETWQINYTPACPNSVTVNETAGGITFQAAIGLISNATISSTDSVNFKAGEYLDLESNFEVIQGGVFSGTIEDCGQGIIESSGEEQ